MMHFIRLTRPVNLIIIGITMYGLGWYFEDLYKYNIEFGIRSFSFFLLVISTIMIAAAGNIINDYFDVRADRINKPEKLIIGKHVKRRVAIITHWALNFVAFSIAVYLSWTFDTFWYLFIHLASINMLWLYSSSFKRKLLIGNFIIASLTAMVPLLVGFYFYHHPSMEIIPVPNQVNYPIVSFPTEGYVVLLSGGLAFFAFLLNLSREVVKDIEDVEGDKKLRAKTLPIAFGVKSSKLFTYFILTTALMGILFVFFMFPILMNGLYTIIIAALFTVLAIALLIQAENRKGYKRVNTFIKLAMTAGMLSPIYWKLLMIYG